MEPWIMLKSLKHKHPFDEAWVRSKVPIIKIVNGILIKAIKLGASDIHFEPYERTFRVRYRIDGVLRREMTLPIQIKKCRSSPV